MHDSCSQGEGGGGGTYASEYGNLIFKHTHLYDPCNYVTLLCGIDSDHNVLALETTTECLQVISQEGVVDEVKVTSPADRQDRTRHYDVMLRNDVMYGLCRGRNGHQCEVRLYKLGAMESA